VSVTFRVHGDPRPQGSKRAFVNRKTGKPILTESAGKPLKDWRSRAQDAVRYVAEQHAQITPGPLPMVGPVAVRMIFYLLPPKKKPGWPAPPQRPDIEKLARAVCDELYPLLISDDSQIVRMRLVKQWASEGIPPGVQVWVEAA
jgi:Holliday junction resolvase RusA-like endonuclease